MKEHKLTVRVTTEILDGAKYYARKHGTNLTRLVTAYLELLGTDRLTATQALEATPITRRLVGILPPHVSPRDLLVSPPHQGD